MRTRSSGLDDPCTLVEYPRSTVEELERGSGRTLVGLDALAPSGAASSGQSTTTYGHGVPVQVPEWPGVASGSGDVGGDPKTDHFVQDTGGDPKTDHVVPLVFVGETETMAATCPPYRPGAVAPQTAKSSAAAPTAVLDFSVGDGHPDEFSITHAERRDEFPSTAESRDGFPSSDHLNSTLDDKSTVFTPILHIAENSERLRESDFGVQIVPASRSPSELSAHQMGLSLAGTSRLKIEPIASTVILDIREPVKLSISDRVLLRRFNSSEQGKEDSQNAALFKQEDSKTVSRVDGHSLSGTAIEPLRSYVTTEVSRCWYEIYSLAFFIYGILSSCCTFWWKCEEEKKVLRQGELIQSQFRSGRAERGKYRSRRLLLWMISIQGCRAFCSFWTRHFTIDAGFWIIRFNTSVLHTRVG